MYIFVSSESNFWAWFIFIQVYGNDCTEFCWSWSCNADEADGDLKHTIQWVSFSSAYAWRLADWIDELSSHIVNIGYFQTYAQCS